MLFFIVIIGFLYLTYILFAIKILHKKYVLFNFSCIFILLLLIVNMSFMYSHNIDLPYQKEEYETNEKHKSIDIERTGI